MAAEVDESTGQPLTGAEQHQPEQFPIQPAPQATWTPEHVAVLIHILEVDIPTAYTTEFAKYKPALSRTLALANIERKNIPRYLDYLDIIVLWYKVGRPDMARKRMMRMIAELMLTRSVNGFERLAQVTARMEQKQTLEQRAMKEKRGFSLFRKE